MAADEVRKRLHPERIVTYSFDESGAASERLVFPSGKMEECIKRLLDLRGNTYSAVLPWVDGTAVEYLKVLALTRIYLDGVPHVQTSCADGLKLCQIALAFGADDITVSQNEKRRPTPEELRRLIRDAGFQPKERDSAFGYYFLD